LNKLRPLLLCVTFGVYLQAAQTPVALGSAGTFSVLAASTVTNTGPSVVNGDLGVSPGTAVTGFPPGSVVGGSIHAADVTAALAQNDLTTAYNDAAGRTLPVTVSGDIGGQTLTPGLYKATTSLGITGILRLDGQGNANSVFIFQIGSTLTTASGSQVILQGGAQAANIFWQVGSSATLGTGSIFAGTIMAQASVTVTTGAALVGRALARTGAVTLDSNAIVNPGAAVIGVTPPTLSVACPVNVGQLNVAFNSAVVAAGGTSPFTFSITGSLPQGLSLSATGAITGTPTFVSTFPFTVRAQDSVSVSATANCSITITAPSGPGGGPPTVPAPSSWILVSVGFVCLALYSSRERLLRLIRSTRP
jgi:hypothetical protein